MKIIDFEVKGNVVRFYLGNDDVTDYYGDDWDDAPYEHNAGRVYDEFIVGHKDIAFDFDDIVMEPCNGHENSVWCKNDMEERRVPCICVLPKEFKNKADKSYWQFEEIIGNDNSIKYYFGDKI